MNTTPSLVLPETIIKHRKDCCERTVSAMPSPSTTFAASAVRLTNKKKLVTSTFLFIAATFGSTAVLSFSSDAASSNSAATAIAVPDRMALSQTMKKFKWSDSSVVPLDLTVGTQELPVITGQEAIEQNTGTAGSIAFVVRRPG